MSSAALFRLACGRFATGVAVLATRAADGIPHGLTINSFSSISLDPPLVMVAIAHDCSILEHFGENGFYAVNILREEQIDLSIRFAELPEGRFTGIAWLPGLVGAPLIEDALAVLECRTVQSVEVGDHRVLIGEVVDMRIGDGRPLVFFSGGYTGLT